MSAWRRWGPCPCRCEELGTVCAPRGGGGEGSSSPCMWGRCRGHWRGAGDRRGVNKGVRGFCRTRSRPSVRGREGCWGGGLPRRQGASALRPAGGGAGRDHSLGGARSGVVQPGGAGQTIPAGVGGRGMPRRQRPGSPPARPPPRGPAVTQPRRCPNWLCRQPRAASLPDAAAPRQPGRGGETLEGRRRCCPLPGPVLAPAPRG